MVSQVEPAASSYYDQKNRRRGPSTVVSRLKPSRTERYNRSHAGGASYVPQNEFPVFAHSGDVEIIIRAGPLKKRYLLHRHTLTRCSGFFEASTSDEWSRATTSSKSKPTSSQRQLAAGNELARVGENGSAVDGSDSEQAASTLRQPPAAVPNPEQRKRWKYELDWGSDNSDISMLVQKDPFENEEVLAPIHNSIFGNVPLSSQYLDSHTRSKHNHAHSQSLGASENGATTKHHSFSRSVANLSLPSAARNSPRNGPTAAVASPAEEDLLRDYDNLLRIFYNYPPLLDGVNVADAYVQCKRLLSLADQYDALAVVGPRVDHHLLQFQARLWKQVAKYPVSYLRLGYLARSKLIFQEALVHVVGQWPTGERSLRASLPDAVMDLIEDKVDELEENVSRVESRLFRINLFTARGERVTPSTSYLDWLVVSLFRQWLADNTTPQPSRPPPSHSHSHSHNQHTHSAISSSSHRHWTGSSATDGRTSSSSSSSITPVLPPSHPPISAIGRAYRALAGRPVAFLGHSVCKEFLKLTPDLYSRENLRRFEKRMDEVKAMAREVVSPLMGSNLELDLLVGSGAKPSDGIVYLTCTAIRDRDLPWSLDD